MNTLKAHGRLLSASADSRVLRYLLLPFGETGRTSAGAITASADSVSYPEDVTGLIANMEHDSTRPVAKFVSIEKTDAGLVADLRVAATSAGNDLLVEAAEGLRTGISVEIESPVIRAGALLAGDLTGAGFVTSPAFPSALLTAADTGDLDPSPSGNADSPSDTPAAEALSASEATADDEPTKEEESPVENSLSAPADLLVASAKNGANQNKDKDGSNTLSLSKFATLVASHHKAGTEHKLTAALEEIGIGSVYEDITQPQFLGELWDGRSFTPRYAPLVSSAVLTGRKAIGWRFVETPTVGDYAGFPNEVPTSDVSTEPVEINAARLAGGWKLDREFIDFNETAFITSFFRHATDDYSRKLDVKVLNALSLAASANPVTGGSVPSGMSAGSTKIVDGALALLADDVVPTFALIGADLYRGMLLTPKDQVFEYLTQALGLEAGSLQGFTIVPSAALTGRVIVGAREAATLFQLPGSPIRVSALDVAHAGTDEALYGYYALLMSNKGLVEVV